MPSKGQNGFTLVELAIVLMIIGLLIGGILRGQEMMENARVAATAKQILSMDAAALSFIEQFRGFPGDLTNPDTRVPNCTAAPCNTPGDGDGRIGPLFTNGGSLETANAENLVSFLQLSAANLVSGVSPNSGWTSGAPLSSADFPRVPLGGMMAIANFNIPAGSGFWPEALTKHWIVLFRFAGGGTTTGARPYSLSVLAKLDKKIDDGRPYTGMAVLNSSDCNNPSMEYQINSNNDFCTFMVKTHF